MLELCEARIGSCSCCCCCCCSFGFVSNGLLWSARLDSTRLEFSTERTKPAQYIIFQREPRTRKSRAPTTDVATGYTRHSRVTCDAHRAHRAHRAKRALEHASLASCKFQVRNLKFEIRSLGCVRIFELCQLRAQSWLIMMILGDF